MPRTLFKMLITRWPARSRTSRSLPNSLIELAPLTPERASSTLSRINCEKLMLTDGNVLELLHQLVLDLFAGDLASPDLMAQDHDRFFPPLLHRGQGGVELEIEIAGDVGAVVGTADVGHDPLDLGDRADHFAQPRRHPRRFLKRHRPRQEARIQRLPSSSGGMNSPPSLGISVIVKASSPPIAASSRYR